LPKILANIDELPWSRLIMQRSDSSKSPRSAKKVSRFQWGRKAAPVSSLKQRMEDVLKGDRQSIQDPLAHLNATYFAD
jgi:hypothetical protein